MHPFWEVLALFLSFPEANEEAADAAAVEDDKPLPATKYKVQIAKTLVKRVLLAAVKIFQP